MPDVPHGFQGKNIYFSLTLKNIYLDAMQIRKAGREVLFENYQRSH